MITGLIKFTDEEYVSAIDTAEQDGLNVINVIGRYAVLKKLNKMDVDFDGYQVKGKQYLIKSCQNRNLKYIKYSNNICTVYEHQRDVKGIDIFIFTNVNFDEMRAYVLGWIDVDEFYKIAQHVEGEYESYKITAKDLKPFMFLK